MIKQQYRLQISDPQLQHTHSYLGKSTKCIFPGIIHRKSMDLGKIRKWMNNHEFSGYRESLKILNQTENKNYDYEDLVITLETYDTLFNENSETKIECVIR